MTQSGHSEPFQIIPTWQLGAMLSPSLHIENCKDYMSTDLLVFPTPGPHAGNLLEKEVHTQRAAEPRGRKL